MPQHDPPMRRFLGSPEGTAGPPPCWQGVVGYTTYAPQDKPSVYPVRGLLCCERRAGEQHNQAPDVWRPGRSAERTGLRTSSQGAYVVYCTLPISAWLPTEVPG